MAPIQPPHPKRTLQTIDVILTDLQTFIKEDPESSVLREAESTAVALQKLLSTYSDSCALKDA